MRLPDRTVRVTTRSCAPGRYTGALDVGPASFLDRPDAADAAVWFFHGAGEDIRSVLVGGDVVLVGEGVLRELPE